MSPGPPDSPVDAARSPAPRAWLLPMLALVALAVTGVELAYQRFPIPPGVDPGDWIQRSYAWVGLPAVTPDAVGSPFLYPPVLFPLLGGIVRITGSPLTAGFLFGGLLLALYGLTTIHLARRYLRTGPGQLLFVGLAVLNGTTLQILFWGGYPNFLAFAVFNEAMVFLLAFLRTRGTTEGIAFWTLASLTYLTHSLTFVMLIGTVAFAGILLLLEDRGFLRILRTRGNLIGVAILAVTLGVYNGLLRYYAIETPGYFGANPAAYILDNLGQIFRPLVQGPTFTPAGPFIALAPNVALAILLGVAALVAVTWAIAGRWAGHRELRWTLAAGAALTALLVPAVGWLAHGDTDYTRFVYFLPFPAALGLALAADMAIERFEQLPSEEPDDEPTSAEGTRRRPMVPPGARPWLAPGAVVAVLAMLSATVSVPTMTASEQIDAGSAHDAQFLATLRYLEHSPIHGNVLTLQSAVRWTEAITSRGAFDVGPTWILFEPWQIVNAQESYWAFNSRYALTNNLDVLGFSSGYSGADVSPITSAPLYAVYAQGVAVPILNLQTGGVLVNASGPGGPRLYAAGQWAPPTLEIAGGVAPAAWVNFTGPLFNVTEIGRTDPAGGALLTVSVLPAPGVTVHELQLGFSPPASTVALLHAPPSAGVVATPTGLRWTVNATLVPQAAVTPITTSLSFDPAPLATAVSPPGHANAAALQFGDPGGGPMSVAVRIATPGTGGNPAVRLPALIDTAQFLSVHQIHFLVLPRLLPYALTQSYYQRAYGWQTVYTNSGWAVMTG